MPKPIGSGNRKGGHISAQGRANIAEGARRRWAAVREQQPIERQEQPLLPKTNYGAPCMVMDGNGNVLRVIGTGAHRG